MLHKLIMGTMPHLPRSVMRFFAKKYIAGETLEDELAELRKLAAEGFPGIFDILGEGSTTEQLARAAAQQYMRGATAVADAGLDTYISIKPTHLGLTSSESLALELYSEVAQHCAARQLLMRVEMEDHTTTTATLRIFEALRAKFDNVGIVLQARLFRTLDDIEQLAPGHLDVRMVKGIYLEPADIAHTSPEAITQAFLHCCRRLLERGDVRLRLATHDEAMSVELIRLLKEFEVASDGYEFQVLLGVQAPLWVKWKQAGHVVRVYVPYGPEWREYSQRRLRHNPQLLKAVMRDLLPI